MSNASRPSPQLSVALPSFAAENPGNWQHLFALARAADRAGIDRVVISDHVVFGERLDEYGDPKLGGVAGGRQPTGPDGHWLEPLTTLSVIAGMTSRVRLRTNILIAALRRPVVLAKTCATLDVLSGGRLDLGVGVGWQREEYEAAGLDFGDRGRLLDHTLEVCQTLWSQKRASYSSPELRFQAIHQMPKPTQAGGVPIWVSGSVNRAVVRRLSRFGVGWIPWGPAAEDPATIAELKGAIESSGRDPESLAVAGRLPVVLDADGGLDLAATMARVPALAAAGVTDFVARWPLPTTEAAMEEELRRVVIAFQATVDRTSA